MPDLLPCVELNPDGNADASIIWLHGLGANGHDFVSVVPELRLPSMLPLRFVFPHAPSIPVTINSGYVMPAWFDVMVLGQERSFNATQLLASSAAVHALIDREIERGVASDRILLAGFSQGGAVCFQAGLTYDKPLAGMMALSTWFPTAAVVDVHPANSGLPILLTHGTQDNVLPLQMALNSKQYLVDLGFHPDFRTYPMAHHVSADEIGDMSEFIQRHLIA
jgi:phospholipase/carboxylesterase